MTIRKFSVEVIRTDYYDIEIDDTVYNDEWKKHFESYMFPVENLEEVAKHIAQIQARLGVSFIEGFGHVKRNGKLLFGFEDFDEKGDWLPEDKRRQPAPGLNIFIDSEDDDIEFNITEITPEGGTL